MTETPDRRNQILDAALHEFAEKGFRGATIKSIALRAGLTAPALIYWYFPTKAALLEAVIQHQAEFLQVALEPNAIMELPPEVVLRRMAASYLGMANDPTKATLVRLLVLEVLRGGEQSSILTERFFPQVQHFLMTYLQHQIDLGRLRPHNPASSLRVFMGSLMPMMLGKTLIPALAAQQPSDDEHIETLLTIFLHGLKGSAE